MKDKLTGRINNETVTKAVCNKGFSGNSSTLPRSNFGVGGQVSCPQFLTALSLNRYPKIFCNGICRIVNPDKILYLSFDDGPNPMVTENVLELLDKYNAKASFFCKGSNAMMYSELLQKIKNNGHTVGNHSFSHLNAFKVSNKRWLIDALRKSPVSDTFFFRPPYGRIYPWQCRRIKKDYKIVLWDVLTYDYHKNYSEERIKRIILKNTRNGSILVFHDNLLAVPKMLKVLEFTLLHYSKIGYKFDKI